MGRCKICGKPTYGNFPYCRECYDKQKEKGEEPKEQKEDESGKGVCQICGKPSGRYPLCYEHSQMIKTGEVVKCDKCGTWHFAKEVCPICNKKTLETPQSDLAHPFASQSKIRVVEPGH